MKEAVRYLEKQEFITCMHNLGLEKVADIGALFGKTAPSVYKYMDVTSKIEIPNAVVQHLYTIALLEDGERQREVIETAIATPLPDDIDGAKEYGEILSRFGIRANSENIALMFGKSAASIYRANMRGGKSHDLALISHLRTLRLLTDEELEALVVGKFSDQLEEA